MEVEQLKVIFPSTIREEISIGSVNQNSGGWRSTILGNQGRAWTEVSISTRHACFVNGYEPMLEAGAS